MPKRKNKIEISAWSHSRGHSIVIINGKNEPPDNWRFEDNLSICYHQRNCKKCNRYASPHEPDPCLGWLPNVKFACCGHGIKGKDYVLMNNSDRLSLEEYCKLTGFKKPKELM